MLQIDIQRFGGRGGSGGRESGLPKMSVPSFSSGTPDEKRIASGIIKGSIDRINSSYQHFKKSGKAADPDGKETESWKFVANTYSKLLSSGRLSDASYVVSNASKLREGAMGALALSYAAKLRGADIGSARDRREKG